MRVYIATFSDWSKTKIGVTDRDALKRIKEHFGKTASENWKVVCETGHMEYSDASAIESALKEWCRNQGYKLILGSETFSCSPIELVDQLLVQLDALGLSDLKPSKDRIFNKTKILPELWPKVESFTQPPEKEELPQKPKPPQTFKNYFYVNGFAKSLKRIAQLVYSDDHKRLNKIWNEISNSPKMVDKRGVDRKEELTAAIPSEYRND